MVRPDEVARCNMNNDDSTASITLFILVFVSIKFLQLMIRVLKHESIDSTKRSLTNQALEQDHSVATILRMWFGVHFTVRPWTMDTKMDKILASFGNLLISILTPYFRTNQAYLFESNN